MIIVNATNNNVILGGDDEKSIVFVLYARSFFNINGSYCHCLYAVISKSELVIILTVRFISRAFHRKYFRWLRKQKI